MLKPTNEPEGLANSKSSCTPKVPSVALSCKAAKFLDIAALSLLEAIAPSYPRFVGELLRKTNFFVYSFIDSHFSCWVEGLKDLNVWNSIAVAVASYASVFCASLEWSYEATSTYMMRYWDTVYHDTMI